MVKGTRGREEREEYVVAKSKYRSSTDADERIKAVLPASAEWLL